MKELIPTDVLLSSFGSIEGGIIILNPKGKVVYINDWVLDHSIVFETESYAGKTLNEVFDGNISQQLLSAVDNAITSSLSRVLSHKIHKKLLPLYFNKNDLKKNELNISALVTPLKGMTGILIRLVDYTSLVKRERHIRINESLLKIEKDFFKKASDLSVTLDDFVGELVDEISSSIDFVSIGLSLLQASNIFRRPQGFDSVLLTKGEKFVRHQVFEGGDLVEKIANINLDQKKQLVLIVFSDEKVRGLLELTKESDSILDISFDKAAVKIKDLLLSLIEWKINYEKLSYMAAHDELTGLYNRAFLVKKFDDLKQGAQGDRSVSFSLFFIDLNKFKEINDNYGHRCGDKVLVKVSQRIKSSLQVGDIAFRIGGDEILVIRKEVYPEEYVKELKEKISTPFLYEEKVLSISASIGYANFPEDGHSLDELMHLADEKMYTEK